MTVTDRGGRSDSQTVHISVGTLEEARPQRPSIVGLLLLAGGVLVLVSVAGILFFMARARRT
jgi:hypothetical protein